MKELIMAETKIFADTSDIAKMLNVGVQTIRGWANQKKIPSMKLPNGKFVFDPDAVIATLKPKQKPVPPLKRILGAAL